MTRTLEEDLSEFLQAREEGQRQAIIGTVLNRTASDPENTDLIALAMRLRAHGSSSWAEALFNLALMIPRQRSIARYEMAVLFSLQGRLARAIELFDDVRRESPLSPAQKFYVARQYARSGDFTTADTLLEKAVEEDRQLYRQALAESEFFSYIRKYPLEAAVSAHDEEASFWNVVDCPNLARSVADALDRREPMSVIRLGDGEGIYLQISLADEAEFSNLYDRGRAEFHRIWYSGTDLLTDPDFINEIYRVEAAYRNADCLSLLNTPSIRNEYRMGSPRGVPAMNNLTRFLRKLRQGSAAPKALCVANINRDMLLAGELARLVQGRAFVGLVSCYDDLPAHLMRRFGVGSSDLIRTYGEHAARLSMNEAGQDARPGRCFIESHWEICERFNAIRPGELYLVAAGIFGKIYCDIIKRQGGIALDIGSVADIWMGVGTRTFSADERAHALV
jgi:tetratricopeptide (TPR) repeat protein